MEMTSVIMRIKRRQPYQLLPTPVCSFTIWQNAASQIPLQVEQNSEANPVWGPAELMTEPGAYLSTWARVDALWEHLLNTDFGGELVIYFSTKIGHLFQPFASTVGQWIGSLRISTWISFVFLGSYFKALYFVQIWCWKICGYKIPGLLRW